jgi:hypothetical protein
MKFVKNIDAIIAPSIDVKMQYWFEIGVDMPSTPAQIGAIIVLIDPSTMTAILKNYLYFFISTLMSSIYLASACKTL